MKNPAVVVNLENLEHNLGLVSDRAQGADIIAVVKSNAYGHGIVGTAIFLQEKGVRRFAVGTVAEGVVLRDSGINGEIIVLGATMPENIGQLVEFDLSQSVFGPEYADLLRCIAEREKVKVKIHVKINTGMNRLGFDWLDARTTVGCCSAAVFQPCGVFTHFGSADGKTVGADLRTRLQGERFLNCLTELEKEGFEVRVAHCCNSAALFHYPQYRCDAVRVGAALYGIGGIDKALKPVIALRAPLLQVRRVNAGDYVGYGEKQIDKNARLGVVGLGYGQGVSRRLSDRGYVSVNGQKRPIVGKVCMDFLTVDLTGTEARAGDDVWIVGGSISAATVARTCGTVDYETVATLSPALERVFLN